MKLTILLLTLSFSFDKININNIDSQSLEAIPLDSNKINAIIEYMNYVEGIDNIYELLEIEEINSKDISILFAIIRRVCSVGFLLTPFSIWLTKDWFKYI